MTLLHHIATWATAWVALSIPAGLALGALIKRADKAEEPAEFVYQLSTRPPVPPSRNALLADQPTEILAGTELEARFLAIVNGETRWFA